jgi:hypothetical protein
LNGRGVPKAPLRRAEERPTAARVEVIGDRIVNPGSALTEARFDLEWKPYPRGICSNPCGLTVTRCRLSSATTSAQGRLVPVCR